VTLSHCVHAFERFLLRLIARFSLQFRDPVLPVLACGGVTIARFVTQYGLPRALKSIQSSLPNAHPEVEAVSNQAEGVGDRTKLL